MITTGSRVRTVDNRTAALFTPYVGDIDPPAMGAGGKHVHHKQRIAAVAALEALGLSYTPDLGWFPPINSGRAAIGGTLPDFTAEADARDGKVRARRKWLGP